MQKNRSTVSKSSLRGLICARDAWIKQSTNYGFIIYTQSTGTDLCIYNEAVICTDDCATCPLRRPIHGGAASPAPAAAGRPRADPALTPCTAWQTVRASGLPPPRPAGIRTCSPSPPSRSRGLGDPRGQRRGSQCPGAAGALPEWGGGSEMGAWWAARMSCRARHHDGNRLAPVLHRVFVRCKRSLVRWNRISEGYKILERLVYSSFSGKYPNAWSFT